METRKSWNARLRVEPRPTADPDLPRMLVRLRLRATMPAREAAVLTAGTSGSARHGWIALAERQGRRAVREAAARACWPSCRPWTTDWSLVSREGLYAEAAAVTSRERAPLTATVHDVHEPGFRQKASDDGGRAPRHLILCVEGRLVRLGCDDADFGGDGCDLAAFGGSVPWAFHRAVGASGRAGQACGDLSCGRGRRAWILGRVVGRFDGAWWRMARRWDCEHRGQWATDECTPAYGVCKILLTPRRGVSGDFAICGGQPARNVSFGDDDEGWK